VSTDTEHATTPDPYYQDDYVTLYHGDCLTIDAWLAADVLVTDPPYGIAWTKNTNNANGSMAHAGILNDEDTSMRDAALALAAGKPAAVFGSFYAPEPIDVRQILVWRKPGGAGVVGSTTGFRRDVEPVFLVGPWPVVSCHKSSLLWSNGNTAHIISATGHPHTKPQDVLTELIEACPPGTVADPFAGSGSTLVAAKRLGRKAIGVELDERYCEIAAKRLAQGVLDFGASA